MGNSMITDQKDRTPLYFKYFYVAFLLMGLYYLLQKEYGEAASIMGIGLIFDPFNHATPFPQRPRYQKLVLVVHLAAVLVLFALTFIAKG